MPNYSKDSRLVNMDKYTKNMQFRNYANREKI